MTTTKPSIYPFSSLNFSERARAARQLPSAVHSNEQLSRELPIPAHYYGTPLSAFRRLGFVRARQAEAGLLPAVISSQGRFTGIATAQSRRVNPDLLEGSFANRREVELSYWHADVKEAVAIDIGKTVVSWLAYKVSADSYDSNTLWMVTLPEDEVKAAVLTDLHFESVSEPRPFEIEDNVTIPRQLWAREST